MYYNKKFIRDNVHGDIDIIDDIVLELINTPEFQRLRRVIQLGGGQFVFPSANHTRFSHCLGVYYIICKFLENKDIEKNIEEEDQQILKIAGLLHDIGHGPFSHSFELISNQSHETYTSQIIEGDTEINKILQKHNIDPKKVSSVIKGTHKNNIVNMLVSSQLDADRLDYLLRDGVNAGVNYSSVDVNWIIRNATIKDKKIAFAIKTKYSIEAYLLGRFNMYKQVYNHKVSEGFDRTLLSWFKRLKHLFNNGFEFKNKDTIIIFDNLFNNKPLDIKEYMQLDDYYMSYIIKKCMDEKDEILSDLANRIINRNFFTVWSLPDEKSVKSILKNQKIDLEYYYGEFSPRNFDIYNTLSEEKDETIYMIDNKDNLIPINKVSKILNIKVDNKSKKMFFFPKDKVE